MATKVEAGVTTAYTYDAENRLTKVTKNNSTIAQYEYDGDGGRTKKTATINGVTTTTTFVGSLFESDSKGRSTKYIFLGDQRVASITQSPTLTSNILYYHADHLGGANVLIDANGLKKELIEYEPFGQESRHEKYSSVSSEEIAWYYFTGKPKDDETGLIYFGARYYDPALGRFITADTIVQAPYDPQTLNRYSYTSNNPTSRIDHDGHKWSWGKFWKSFVGAVVGVVAAVVTAGLSIGFSVLASQGFSAIGAGAWAVGGAIGGATTAALNGANGLGILQGAAIGGALGGLGGWAGGLNNGLGNAILGGMLAGGIASAAISDSWDSFAGGLTGGIAGGKLAMGAVKQYQAWKTANNNQYSSGTSTAGGTTNSKADGNANKALVVDKGKGASGDPIIDDPSVRAQMLKALNDLNEKNLEWGGKILRKEG